MNNYRKIYETNFGPIPVDEFGRTYDIHHVDGDHSNNSPDNLIAVTIQEHYDIHYKQGDFGACYYIMLRMNKTAGELSEIARMAMIDRFSNQTHHVKGRSWYNNGKEQKMLFDPPTDEWVKGRLPFDNIGSKIGALKQKGKRWFNNGTEQGMFIVGEQPVGWNNGRLPSPKKGKRNPQWSSSTKLAWEKRKEKDQQGLSFTKGWITRKSNK